MFRFLALIFALAAGGCTVVQLEKPDGTKVFYGNTVFNKKIGRLSIPTELGPAELEQLDSQQDVTNTINEAIRRIPFPSAAPPAAPVQDEYVPDAEESAWAERWKAARGG